MFALATRPFGLATVPSVALACLVGLVFQTDCMASERGSIFLIEDGSGAIHLSDQASGPGARLVVGSEASPARLDDLRSRRQAPELARDARLAEIVRTAASTHRIAPELLQAVIAAESGYAVRAVSPRGAQGLMQLMPATARDYGVTNAFDPRQNVNAGAQHLRRLLDQFGQDNTLALAAYNAGAAAVVRYRNNVPPFAETTAYVPRVLQYVAQLRGASNNLSGPAP